MKNILVPTDFSKNAENALRYALQLSQDHPSQIHLLHTYELPRRADSHPIAREIIETDAKQSLAELKTKMEVYTSLNTSILSVVIQGTLVDSIGDYTKKNDIDFIVMGTQGASGLKEVFLGSNTSTVMQQSTIPILAIPNDFIYRPIRTIVLAVDADIIVNGDIFQPILEIVRSYDARIEVFHLNDDKALVGVDPGIEIYLKGTKHGYHQAQSGDVNVVVDDFTKRIKGDLLCMIRRKRSFLNRLFFQSVTTQEIFHSPIPVLILMDRVK